MEEGFVFRGCELPPGFRFQPTDQEIIVCYLKRKVASAASAVASAVTSIIADVDIYKFDPWELPDKAQFGEGEWFFFSPRDRKYPNGARPNRTAGSGYWKATGTDKPILAAGGARCLGVKKALVFYQGRSPRGTKTEWVMHEYRLLHADAGAATRHKPHDSMRLDEWVLCRVRKKGVAVAPDMDGNPGAPSHAKVQAIDSTTATAHGAFGDDWTDGQLLQYLMSGGSGQVDGAGAISVAAGHVHDGARRESAPEVHLASVLENIKRDLSFHAMDDVYFLQPSKRANCMGGGAGHHTDGDQLSPPTSLSMFEDD
ncbi:unnamed protein product [Triticum turgidum subsp. durum]|uniref:NAC domain-containing protein n=1 Tax=Triticum turgidum subsp. durum TaxID=4567 RepID=A0A9R1QDI1_TRITD|nr:unnamed protein product [Triticum turgidum subsp. durum]